MKNVIFFLVAQSLSTYLSAVNLKPFGVSAINSLFSDHEAFAMDIPLGGKNGTVKINFLSWNTWARGSRGGFDDNTPGFTLRVEPNANKRIANNFALVAKFMNDNTNAIVALQEVENNDIKQLQTLGNNIISICSNTKRENFNTCILYKSTEFKLDGKSSSNDIRVLNSLNTENAPIAYQRERYMHLKLKNIKSNENVDIVNVHLRWHSKADDIINAINSYFSICKGTCIIAGDFNQNLKLSKVDVRNATLFVYENSSVSSENKQRKINSTEGMSYRLGTSK